LRPNILKARARSKEQGSPDLNSNLLLSGRPEMVKAAYLLTHQRSVMMIQERFDLTLDLIRRRGECFSFLPNLLRICHSTVLVFSFFNRPSRGNTRQNVLAAYELRAELLTDVCCIAGYAVLLAGLREAKHTHICISVFTTEAGTFAVFSDFDREDLVGALYKPEAPEEVPPFSHLFMNGALLSRERG
jgi:hypothetical protein